MHVMFSCVSVCVQGQSAAMVSHRGQFHSLRVLLVSSIPDHGPQNQSQGAVSVKPRFIHHLNAEYIDHGL